MQDHVKKQIESLFSMSEKERNILLCKLSVKEQFNNIEPIEILQLSIIQEIRRSNGEIDEVLKNWEEYPDCDPRI